MKPTTYKEVLAYIQNEMRTPGIQIESTGGKPSERAKSALEAALGDFDARKHTTADHVESALECYADDDDDASATVPLVADSAIGIAANEYATAKCMADGWDGDVSDGASFVVVS
jgi:hypothetical protein